MSLKVTVMMKIIGMKKNFFISKGEKKKLNMKNDNERNRKKWLKKKKRESILLEKFLDFDLFLNNIRSSFEKKKEKPAILF